MIPHVVRARGDEREPGRAISWYDGDGTGSAADPDRCPFCGGPVEGGHLNWSGYPLHWVRGYRGEKWRVRRRDRERLRRVRWFRPFVPARRCTACRKLWFDW